MRQAEGKVCRISYKGDVDCVIVQTVWFKAINFKSVKIPAF